MQGVVFSEALLANQHGPVRDPELWGEIWPLPDFPLGGMPRELPEQRGLCQRVGVFAMHVQRDPAGGRSLYVWDLELLPEGGNKRGLPNPLLGPGNGQGGKKTGREWCLCACRAGSEPDGN